MSQAGRALSSSLSLRFRLWSLLPPFSHSNDPEPTPPTPELLRHVPSTTHTHARVRVCPACLAMPVFKGGQIPGMLLGPTGTRD